MTSLRRVLMLLLCLLLTACATATRNQSLDSTLLQYAKYIRWSEYESALGMHSPQYLARHPITDLDLSRLKLFRVTGYNASERNFYDDGNRVEQRVVISMYNAANAREVSVVHNQVWQYDEDLERWLLHSPLPDVTKTR